MSIKGKLIRGFSLIFIIVIFLAGLLFWSLQKSRWQQRRIAFAFSELTKANKTSKDINRQLKEAFDILLFGEREIGEYERYKEKVLNDFDEWEKLIHYEIVLITPSEATEKLIILTTLRKEYVKIFKGVDEIFKLDKDEYELAMDKLEEIISFEFGKKFQPWIEEIIKDEEKEVNRVNFEATKLTHFTRVLSGSSIGVAFILIALISTIIIRGIVSSLDKLCKGARDVGLGHYDTKVDTGGQDEFGELSQSFNQMACDLHKSREQLLFAKNYTDSIITNMMNTLVVVDCQGKIKTVNRATLDLLGYNEEELIGEPLEKIFIEGEEPSGRLKIIDLIKKGSARSIEKIYLSKNQKEIPVLFSGAVMRNSESKVEGIVCVAGDITERKQVENLKDEFVSIVSHELRTPLAITKEGISLLLDKIPGEINEKQTKVLTAAKNNIDRLARIIDSLLDISRIEAKEVELKKELIDITNLAKKVILFFKPRAEDKGLELRVNFPKEEIEIFGDSDKITQVFTNLVGNAIKFTEKGCIEISVKELEAGVECAVVDTGRGIVKGDLPKVFGKFQQFERTAGGAGEKGTGLGLSIAKGIVQMHNGQIAVESEPGKGTKFIFILPKYSSELFFKECVSRKIRETKKKDLKIALIMVSLAEVDGRKSENSYKGMCSILKDMESVAKGALRQPGDVVVRGRSEIIVLLADCDKEGALRVESRVRQAMEDCLSKISNFKIKLKFATVVYPDEAKTAQELIEKCRGGFGRLV
ncbi:MAG: PAS domain S-box protein [Candidatus Omnitrophica bacterium]|nr:PAS domain S-box protein [Candidatus Omnitrophota bacterium]MBU0896653.1 PAS domain S-box protein [Candidatus Omnitrophota bacterium]MBU1133533.1 PAS domain S-box protein [Candidatus Omnitrophota bacterium]MBU1366687.1 PAS domain S-box protein [Candidatus Omnitrophota bacterium]MBU1810063.1 PAS domain S-box protein [Candidatus Omnitrophota bacterium]